MSEKKKVDIVVVYGFHPEEPLAEEVGKNLKEINRCGVEVIRFRPSCIKDDLHRLPEEEARKKTYEGERELSKYIDENYGKVGFVLDLHETPMTIMHECPQYEILFPGWNQRLRKTLKTFVKNYEEPVWIIGLTPKGFPSYHAASIEYYSRIKTNDKVSRISKRQGTKFAKDVIDHLLSHYLA